MIKQSNKQIHLFGKIFLISTFFLVFSISPVFSGTAFSQTEKKWRILHIMSYHSPWKWTDDQLSGFKSALKDLEIEYKVFQMDTKRNSSEKAKQLAGKRARDLIESWKPDLVYANDDDAQVHVVQHYVNRDLPFVFSGVNLNPYKYGYVGSENITGIMEQEHFIESVKLLKGIAPDVKKIAVIFDQGPTWEGVGGRMLTHLTKLSDIKVVSWDIIKTFKEYKNRILALQTEADAIALLGIFTYKDDAGENVPYTEVLRWTTENSKLPDFSFWKDRISYGTLCTVTVSGYEQGLAAGKLARRILVDGESPGSLTMRPSVKGEPVVSLARANKLGIKINAKILLTADVVDEFKWEQ